MTRHRPQRLARSATPGSMLKRAVNTPRVVKLRAGDGERDPSYLEQIRQLPCLKCMCEPCEAAHIRMQSAAHGKRGGIGKKPADRWSAPLCHEHHREQHQVGELKFWYDLRLNPLFIAEKLYARRDDLLAMRAVILQAIAERSSVKDVASNT